MSLDRELVAATKTQLRQLLEVNRALTQDLDLSHRRTATLARERDQLQRQLAQLQQVAGAPQLARYDEQLRRLLRQLREVERERDRARLELQESTEALEEIRQHLLELLEPGSASSTG